MGLRDKAYGTNVYAHERTGQWTYQASFFQFRLDVIRDSLGVVPGRGEVPFCGTNVTAGTDPNSKASCETVHYKTGEYLIGVCG